MSSDTTPLRFPRLVELVRAPDGAVALIDMSLEQLTEIANKDGSAAWAYERKRHRLGLTVELPDAEVAPLVQFNVTSPEHRMALEDIIVRGTLHIAPAESVVDNHAYSVIALDVRASGTRMIRSALSAVR